MRALVIAGILSGSATLAAAQESSVDCGQEATQTAMNICSSELYQAADAELNAVYKQAMAVQRQRDRDAAETAPDHVGAVDALKRALRAWISYRDGHCDGMGYAAMGGSIRPMFVNGCLTDLTRARIGELQALIRGLGG